MKTIELKSKRIVGDKLIPFGFEKDERGYCYCENILDGQFELKLSIDNDGKLLSQLIETAFDEEYVLHLVPDAQGEFVGRVKAGYNAAIDRFIENCCETDVFRSEQARAVIEYARKTYHTEAEYLWEKFSENAVLRRKDTHSWYGILLTVSRRKLGFDSDEIAEILDLRMPPEIAADIIDGKRYLPGYHMNKKHWLTVALDGSVPNEEIFRRIDESYCLANKLKKPKNPRADK